MSLIVGNQLVAFAFFTKTFAIAEGLLPADPSFAKQFRLFNLEKGLCLGLLILLSGVALFQWAFEIWRSTNFGSIPYSENMRRLLPAVTLVVAGIQVIFSSFFMSVLGLKTSTRQPPKLPEQTGWKGSQ
jgi:hypothetical protein